jgi:hypothetical protein
VGIVDFKGGVRHVAIIRELTREAGTSNSEKGLYAAGARRGFHDTRIHEGGRGLPTARRGFSQLGQEGVSNTSQGGQSVKPAHKREVERKRAMVQSIPQEKGNNTMRPVCKPSI